MAFMAAKLAVGIARGHPFSDGNKRTAFLAADEFLRINGYRVAPSPGRSGAMTIVDAAMGKVSTPRLARWLRKRIKKAGEG
ncbi:MAG: type II toxin-antitoxin system death-on-curing family toxin [Thaumarchaeota archaeon]|nr:type II toxin-antitoxin system death-on-curing family toxin [Nitrososphaerota archaeon]